MAVFFNAIGQVWGRRPCYLIATTFLVAATIWSSYVRSYGEFVACRVVSGIAAGPYESVIISSIGDLFFVRPGPLPTSLPTFAVHYVRPILTFFLVGTPTRPANHDL